MTRDADTTAAPTAAQSRPSGTQTRPQGIEYTTTRPISVFVADDHPAVRAGVRLLIDDQPDMIAVGEAATAEEALARIEPAPDVLVLDYHFGGQHNGLWLVHKLAVRPRRPRVLVYSAFADEALAVAAIVAGADGLLSKRSLGEELCDVIRLLARGRRNFPAVSRPIADAMSSRLRGPDQMAFGMLLHGMETRRIAEVLKMSDSELQSRRSAMLRTLAPSVRSTADPRSAPLDYAPLRARLMAQPSDWN